MFHIFTMISFFTIKVVKSKLTFFIFKIKHEEKGENRDIIVT